MTTPTEIENPPAFPFWNNEDLCHEPGMTLRDYFAANADPPQDLENSLLKDCPALKGALDMGQLAMFRAQWRYLEADAMLAERAKGKS